MLVNLRRLFLTSNIVPTLKTHRYSSMVGTKNWIGTEHLVNNLDPVLIAKWGTYVVPATYIAKIVYHATPLTYGPYTRVSVTLYALAGLALIQDRIWDSNCKKNITTAENNVVQQSTSSNIVEYPVQSPMESGDCGLYFSFNDLFYFFKTLFEYPFCETHSIIEYFNNYNTVVTIMYNSMVVAILLFIFYFIITLLIRKKEKSVKDIQFSSNLKGKNMKDILQIINVFSAFFIIIIVICAIYLSIFLYPSKEISQFCDSVMRTLYGGKECLIIMKYLGTPVDYYYKVSVIVLAGSLGMYRSISLVSPKSWNLFSKIIVLYLSGFLVNNTSQFMLDQVDIKSATEGISIPDLFDKSSFMLKLILLFSILLVFLIIIEKLFIKVFKRESENTNWPSITELIVILVRVMMGICIFLIFTSTIYLYAHLLHESTYSKFYSGHFVNK